MPRDSSSLSSWLASLHSLVRGAPQRADAKLGRRGEKAAARYLRSRGFRVLARNARVGQGEADLICRDPDRRTIVIVEVKTRLRDPAAPERSRTTAPEVSITRRKRNALRLLANSLRRANRWHDHPMRIDVIAIEWPVDHTPPTIRHHQNAV